MNQPPTAALRWALGLLLILLVTGPASPASAQQALPQSPIPGPKSLTPILPLAQVRVGMKGYGLTVFHGTAIEPFPFEVISVMTDFAPLHPVVWVRCSDERMQQSGAVQGMSGSPMYVWGENEPHTLGKGGKLLGAFAFGYGGTLDCYVGVQPIEFMREIAGRADMGDKPAGAAAKDDASAPLAVSSLRTLLRTSAAARLPASATWQARAIERLMDSPLGATPADNTNALDVAAPPNLGGHAQRLLLPMAVGSARASAILAPLLEPLGLAAMEGPIGNSARMRPPNVDFEAIRFEPGSVLAIPLAWGDLDLSAVGTVTDVTPDGRVLAFGHAMFGQGPLAVPMATGYVHMVMPSRQISFKLANSALIRGSVVRDENSGIVGIGATRYTSAPAHLVINIAGQKSAEFHYEIVHQKSLTPVLAAVVSIESLTGKQNMPIENTAHITGKMMFAGHRLITINSFVPDLAPENLVMQILPPVAAMIQNPHESMMLESMDLTIDVEPVLRVGSIVNARLDRNEIAPGESAKLTVRIQPYGKPAFDRRMELETPESLPEGEYQLIVCDAQNYLSTMLQNRPHLLTTTNADELHAMVQKILGVANDSLYLMLQEKQEGLAIGRQELPRLPSSRKALLAWPTNTLATPYAESIDKAVHLDLVPDGVLNFSLTLKKKISAE